MVFISCPGAKRFKQPEPEIMNCPFCHKEVEIWTDEVKINCPHCKKTIVRKQGATCLDWCNYAKVCLGDREYKEYLKNKEIAEEPTPKKHSPKKGKNKKK